MRVRHSDGSWRWLQLRSSNLLWEGRPARQLLYLDITAARLLEARHEREHERLEARIQERTLELQDSQRNLREKERLAAIGTLAAGIAHQINNPIGAILTSAQFATLVADDEDGDRIRRDALVDIQNEAVRCGKIVRSILQFSRAETTEKWSADLASVLRVAVGVTSQYASDHHADIRLEAAPEISKRTVRMNPIEVEQVFINLIRNAVESRSNETRIGIVVSASLQSESLEHAPMNQSVPSKGKPDDRQHVVVIVEDDGPGIDEDAARHIFEPFYTTRLREGGSGLGLSVAHGIIEGHGGSMWFESKTQEDNSGTRFHVVLPLEPETTELAAG
jgi:signal transduction histidine kinase